MAKRLTVDSRGVDMIVHMMYSQAGTLVLEIASDDVAKIARLLDLDFRDAVRVLITNAKTATYKGA